MFEQIVRVKVRALTQTDFDAAIERVTDSVIAINKGVLKATAEQLPPEIEMPKFGLDILTDREREVVGALQNGRTNKQIANLLNCTEQTVKIHMKHATQKLGVANRTALALWAAQQAITQ